MDNILMWALIALYIAGIFMKPRFFLTLTVALLLFWSPKAMRAARAAILARWIV